MGIVGGSLIELPTPAAISAMWNFGSLLGLCLITQILTGLFLAIHYCGDASLAFSRVSHICRDVNYGWISFGFWFSYSSGFGISRSLATVSTISVTTISITASVSIAIVRFSGTLSTVTTISITTITVSTAIVTIGIGLRFC